jgi:hypothetical protein
MLPFLSASPGLPFAHWRMLELAPWFNSRGVPKQNCARFTAGG